MFYFSCPNLRPNDMMIIKFRVVPTSVVVKFTKKKNQCSSKMDIYREDIEGR